MLQLNDEFLNKNNFFYFYLNYYKKNTKTCLNNLIVLLIVWMDEVKIGVAGLLSLIKTCWQEFGSLGAEDWNLIMR